MITAVHQWKEVLEAHRRAEAAAKPHTKTPESEEHEAEERPILTSSSPQREEDIAVCETFVERLHQLKHSKRREYMGIAACYAAAVVTKQISLPAVQIAVAHRTYQTYVLDPAQAAGMGWAAARGRREGVAGEQPARFQVRTPGRRRGLDCGKPPLCSPRRCYR